LLPILANAQTECYLTGGAFPQEALSLVRQAGSALHGDVSQLLSLIESVRAFESQPQNVALSVAAPLALILANAASEPGEIWLAAPSQRGVMLLCIFIIHLYAVFVYFRIK